jgi:ABC-type multidrug transport system fused ATPase/permease subunit
MVVAFPELSRILDRMNMKHKINTLVFFKGVKQLLSPYLKRHIRMIVLGAIISCLMAGIYYLNLKLIKNIFDVKLYNRNILQVGYLLSAVLGIVMLYYGLNFLLTNLNSRITLAVNRDIIRDCYLRICRMPVVLVSEFTPGQLITLLLNDIVQITPIITMLGIDLVKSSVIVTVVLIYLFKISWISAVVLLCLILIYLLITRYFNSKVRIMIPTIQKTIELFNNKLIDHFQGINLLKIYDLDDYEKNKLDELNQSVANQNMRKLRIENLKKNMIEIMVILVICICVFVGYTLIHQNLISQGVFVTILLACFILNTDLKSIFENYARIQQMSVHLDRIQKAFKIVAESPSYTDLKESKLTLNDTIQSIRFENVYFKYGTNCILQSINCTFGKDMVVGITGESGFGKSTLLNLILQLLVPSEGVIKINDIPLESLEHKNYLKQISYLPQKSFLFQGSFKENIAFGDSTVDMEKMIQSAKMANIHEFISKTPQGYDTIITTNLSSISEGEKKRVEVARAIYKNSAVIVFDEPTESLDLNNKFAIVDMIKALREKIIIVVSHDLYTLEHCDRWLIITPDKHIQELSSFKALYEQIKKNKDNANEP